MNKVASTAVSGSAIALLVVSVALTAACGGAGEGAEDTPAPQPPETAAPATETPTAASTTSPPATTSTPEPADPSTTTPEPAATATPTAQPDGAPATERPPKPDTSGGAERGPYSGEPETRTGKPSPTPDPATGATGKRDGGASGSSQGREYTWRDGDRVRRITLDSGLVVQPSSQNTADDIVTRDDGESSIVERQAWHASSDAQPVFRSPGGQLMTLPGGVLLVLADSWDQARVNRFFSENGISSSAVERQDWAINAFFIQTKPGMPSLNLANQLAVLEGVEISSPNWQTEVSLR